MKVFIKENSLVTERHYDDFLIAILEDEGFVAIDVPDMNDENPYTYDDFEKVNGQWRLK